LWKQIKLSDYTNNHYLNNNTTCQIHYIDMGRQMATTNVSNSNIKISCVLFIIFMPSRIIETNTYISLFPRTWWHGRTRNQ